MNPDVEQLIKRWRLRELAESEVLFLTGAGISNPPPTSFPLGNPLHRLLVSSFSTLTQGEIGALLSLNIWTFEHTCDVIFEEYRKWQPDADVNWFWNLLSEIFIYRPSVAWKQPNDFHAYFRRHIERGGRHFTANLDQFIELESMPYHVLTTCMLESTDLPLNVENVIGEPKIYKFHGDCTADAVHFQGVLHSVIRDGFQANTRRYWSEVLRSVKLVCICGYGGFDTFDVNRYFGELAEGHFEAKAVWVSYAPGTRLEVVPNSQLHQPASMILSRFSESVVLKGESDELLNVLFPDAVPRIRRLPSTGFAPQYEGIFQVNIQAARQIHRFQECLDNITQRLRGIIYAMYVLTPAEHEEARRIAYLIAEIRGGGQLPSYDPAAASDDFCRAAGQVIANRTCGGAGRQENAIRERYPTLFHLLADTPFEADATAAAAFAKSKVDMKAALDGRVFALNELMWLLCGAVFPEWANSEATQLEHDLATIIGTVGVDAARTAYREKFLVEAKSRIQDPQAKILNARNKLVDVRYEIAVTAKACAVLDACSIQLEKPIPDPTRKENDWKNSDVFGTFQGQPVRIEVTVLHESLPPAIHIELDDLVRQSEISSGFHLTLRSVLVDKDYAQRVRALVELLHENHVAFGGEDIEIDSVRFEWKGGAYHCPQETSPIENICFYAASEFASAEKMRDIIHPCSVRPVTSKHVLEDHPNPPGVITLADLPDASTQVPVSTKVGQMLGGKLQQCEDGVINIVAFGNPLPMHDREVINAVCGSEFAGVPFWTDKHGVRHSGKGVLLHDPKAPFVPAQYLPNGDDCAQFIEPFKKMSAVWHFRLGWYAKSQIIPNPNASMPILKDLAEAFSDPAPFPAPNATSDQVDGTTHPIDEQSYNSEQEEDIVWAVVAENYVQVCGTVAEARSVLAKLEQAGLSLDELRKKVEQVWSEPPKEEKKLKFISPTNEDMAMTFVVDCGGYEEAKACLEAYAEKIEGDDRPLLR